MNKITKYHKWNINFTIGTRFKLLPLKRKTNANRTKLFLKLQKSSGATINQGKSTIVPINNNQTIKRRQKGFEETNQLNWNKIIVKMKNHMRKLKQTYPCTDTQFH